MTKASWVNGSDMYLHQIIPLKCLVFAKRGTGLNTNLNTNFSQYIFPVPHSQLRKECELDISNVWWNQIGSQYHGYILYSSMHSNSVYLHRI